MSLPDFSKLKASHVLKFTGVALIVIVFVAIAIRLVGTSVNTLVRKGNLAVSQSASAPSFGIGNMMYEGEKAYDRAGSVMGMPELSVRNVAGIAPAPPYDGGGVTGSDAEEYEVTEYHGTVETRDKGPVCDRILSLKSYDYVIFENANEYDRGCNMTFKVARAHTEEVLMTVKTLNPRELVENTHTIKKQVEDFTSEIEILQNKQAAIDDTLAKATEAYDEITDLARLTGDAESLAKVITSKISIIERLTQERLNINTQFDRLTRAKAAQLDRLEYTYFTLSVVENKFVDGRALKDSWKAALRTFVRDINDIAQDVSVNLATLLLRVLQYLLYAFIILFVVKYAWKAAKGVWEK